MSGFFIDLEKDPKVRRAPLFSGERGTELEEKDGGRKKRRWKMKGQQKKRGNYWSFLMEMVMKWDMGPGQWEARGWVSVPV